MTHPQKSKDVSPAVLVKAVVCQSRSKGRGFAFPSGGKNPASAEKEGWVTPSLKTTPAAMTVCHTAWLSVTLTVRLGEEEKGVLAQTLLR